MLEIFITRFHDVNGKTVTELERIDEIVPDCWINLYSPTEDELERVQKALDLPPEFLRYPLDEEERPRIDTGDEPEQTLIIADLPIVRKEGVSVKYETMPIGIIVVGHKAIVTISLREANVLETFKNNRVRDFLTGYRTRFAFQILHAVAKDFLKYLRFIDKTLDSTERKLTKSVTNKELFKLMELGKSLVYFSTSIKSNEGVLERLMRGKSIKQYEEDQDLLEDVIIENRQAMEMSSTYASIINGTMDANASIISNNLNVVMKFLAAITIVFSIPTVVSSLFGMNIPLPTQEGFASDPWPFAMVLGVILVLSGVVAWWMHKRDML